ncbi:HIRAN domain-containing protein [Glutamicibacter creatinolyticus]|uniref:HIRAN domain-containing protein n=1 Tax=Glutamicibacter creatinolyticus TaxID=162496 RepID=UPI0037BFF41E
MALPDGRLIEPSAPLLRRFGIYGAKIVGTGYYRAGEWARPERMELGLKREPNNEHDSNAVALMRGSRPQQVGHVAKGQARFVAKALDGGEVLVAHVIMGGDWVLITARERWEQLNR